VKRDPSVFSAASNAAVRTLEVQCSFWFKGRLVKARAPSSVGEVDSVFRAMI